ncbi:MAG: ATP-binding protein [Methylomicrobium sp.]|nr:ATP-binding protein [Methylomicrobium sp.]
MAKQNEQFIFEISLSVLNHLGRNLYRSFMTVLGEAISNAWDADAENVWIYIDKEDNTLIVKDDGIGMTAEDFQDKFLKIGYSKRKDGSKSKGKKRPFIGRKGIGKIALLSCAQRIHIFTRKSASDSYVGGIIDNSGLDEAIKSDLTPDQYPLDKVEEAIFQEYKKGHKHGTIIYFENISEGVKNSIEYLRKLIALYFRFSLVDKSFNIFVEDKPITIEDLNDLAQRTEFLWKINELDDPYVTQKLVPPSLKESKSLPVAGTPKGFIASVNKPTNLKVFTTEERIGVDLFVNGRLREKDVLRHIPTARVYESYLYGQIHFNELDDEVDRFTSSREGVLADDPKFRWLLTTLQKEILPRIAEDWDKWRLKNKKKGDDENTRLTPRERTSIDLFNVVSEDFSLSNESAQKKKIDSWVDELAEDAKFNFSSYAECFISENLLRKFIREKNLSAERVQGIIDDLRRRENDNKIAGNINIDIRQNNDDLSYLDMAGLSRVVDPQRGGSTNTINTDAKEYRPIRDALAHTALLTQDAKTKLTAVYLNIKARLRTLLSNP